MKTSLSLFFINLILFSAFISTTSIRVQSFKSMFMNQIASGIFKSNQSSTARNKLLPSEANRGFKCLKIDYSSKNSFKKGTEAIPCARQGETCISQGLVIYMADGKFDFIVQSTAEHILCDSKLFPKIGDVNSANGVCFTQPLSEKKYKDNELIGQKYSSNRICKYHKQSTESDLTFLLQEDTINCGMNSESTKSKVKFVAKKNPSSRPSDADNACYCYSVNIPNVPLSSPYIPVRFSNAGFECINDNKGGCAGSFELNGCIGITEAKTCIRKLPKRYLKFAFNFYFNNEKWLCPSETGLDVAVRYYIDANSNIKISCLGRNGNDCFYNQNAQTVCEKVNSCKEAASESKELVCGSSKFINLYGHDGFNSPLNHFCKRAYAWLIYDGSTIDIPNAGAYYLNEDGVFGCVPNSEDPKVCLSKDSKYEEELSRFRANRKIKFNETILFCGKQLPFQYSTSNTSTSDKDNNIKCSSLVTHDQEGQFKVILNPKISEELLPKSSNNAKS